MINIISNRKEKKNSRDWTMIRLTMTEFVLTIHEYSGEQYEREIALVMDI